MTTSILRPLAYTVALGALAVLGRSLTADPPKPEPVKSEKAVETRTAVAPKPITDSIKKGLAYLVKNQQDDGGWNQGGGWRTAINPAQGGRIEGKEVEDPSDMGNTCYALLALFRAGNTPSEGEYKDAVKKGLRFVLTRVEKAGKDDLYVTDVRNTQLQSKIGPYIDTFLANLVLAELKGKAGEDEQRLIACLTKTMDKVVKNQKADGQFAGNGGWAPVLSLSVANKSVARGQQMGIAVNNAYFENAGKQALASVNGTVPPAASPAAPATAVASAPPVAAPPAATPPTVPAVPPSVTVATAPPSVAPATPVKPVAVATGVPAAKPPVAEGPALSTRYSATFDAPGAAGDAGVSLYRIAQGAANSQDVVNSLRVDADKARQILKDSKATEAQKEQAKKTIWACESAEKENVTAQRLLAENVSRKEFVAGFGSNGGEEFLSFLNISETLVLKGGKEWDEWDGKMRKGLEKAQDQDGSWSGQHCITGRTFCTAGALLVMLADRTPFPAEAIEKARAEKKPEAPPAVPTPGK